MAKNASAPATLFSGDPELWEAQEAQHKLLLEVAKQGGLQEFFEDTANRQINPILLDENGFVVNGNRRLATWRELLHKEKAKYSHFQHIDIAVLPHGDEKELDRLEARLQITKDIRADYSWDAQANMMLAKQKKDGFTTEELADLYDMPKEKILELFDMRAYADEYLKSRGKTNHWSRVAGDELAFRAIVKSRPKVKGLGKQELFKEGAFVLIDNPKEAGGRLYDAIPALQEHIDEVKKKLVDDLKVDAKPISFDPVDDIFGTSTTPAQDDPVALQVAKKLQEISETAKPRKVIVEVLEIQKQLKKEAKSANYLLDSCARAQATLAAAVKDGLHPEAKVEGVTKQVDEIQKHLDKIRAFVAQHANN
ncbi:MAG: hypothetical protein J0J01_29755 [Reyranella sp.]|uniref:hypothetical protein n=1 Tax=Reyranella sp. TaxID=1929291 RepID=UPI001ACF8769|nr:hypothetical protein [Reyranella sp.]MBN9091122.1 hypothetical protein [Reyranella sp.]